MIRDEGGKILLLKVSPHLLKQILGLEAKELWDIPGGRVHPGDSIKQTLDREVKEELGITELNTTTQLVTVISNLRIKTNKTAYGLIVRIYSCQIPKTSQVQLNQENIEYGWFEPNEAAKLLEVKYPHEFTRLISSLK